ncbi:uncharacterized protein SOCE26_069090 [Sorangium cellulosum]|uniref:Uncharacterized protein n=1 Tax=Sorangium cellulosum TaxID=56 RepID=A0A2L0F1G1_SORCE|nr:uncharacterized protein SOCE26_069090 [Sorangium cellulosum]
MGLFSFVSSRSSFGPDATGETPRRRGAFTPQPAGHHGPKLTSRTPVRRAAADRPTGNAHTRRIAAEVHPSPNLPGEIIDGRHRSAPSEGPLARDHVRVVERWEKPPVVTGYERPRVLERVLVRIAGADHARAEHLGAEDLRARRGASGSRRTCSCRRCRARARTSRRAPGARRGRRGSRRTSYLERRSRRSRPAAPTAGRRRARAYRPRRAGSPPSSSRAAGRTALPPRQTRRHSMARRHAVTACHVARATCNVPRASRPEEPAATAHVHSAVELLGSRCLLTGVPPAVAHPLASLRVDLGPLLTLRNVTGTARALSSSRHGRRRIHLVT